jgi:hypothetical protein
VGEPRPCADAGGDVAGLPEVVRRRIGIPGDRGQEAEVAGDWADADLRVADGHAVRIREKERVQRRSARAIADARGRLGQQAHAEEPLLVERKAGGPIAYERGELALRGERPVGP